MIAMFATLVLHDSVQGMLPRGLPAWAVVSGSVAPMAVVAVVVQLVMYAAGKDLDARGSWRAVTLAERTLGFSRVLVVLLHVVNVLFLGLLDLVRGWIGDLIVVDELIVLLPPLLAIAAGWWSFYPIERRLRDATMMRAMDAGKPLYPTPTRWQWLVSNVRHQILLTLVPLTMIMAWTESLNWGLAKLMEQRDGSGRVASVAKWAATHELASLVFSGLQLAGAVTIFALSPLFLRLVWDTVRMGDGELRDRLMGMCRERGVKVRDLLVWRTHGSMINGAVMGLVGPARYILLTDALLDHLPERQVEAVMAHEVGHARLSHVPWLGATMIATAGAGSVVAGLVAYGLEKFGGGLNPAGASEGVRGGLEIGFSGLSLVAVFIVFGLVSRRFEWQADAFAAKHLSRMSPLPGSGPALDGAAAVAEAPGTVRTEAVESMAGALESVAMLNHIPRAQRSFRHGSIALRQAKLRAMIGLPIEGLPIDKASRRIKAIVAIGVAVVVGTVVWEVMRTPPVDEKGVDGGAEVDR